MVKEFDPKLVYVRKSTWGAIYYKYNEVEEQLEVIDKKDTGMPFCGYPSGLAREGYASKKDFEELKPKSIKIYSITDEERGKFQEVLVTRLKLAIGCDLTHTNNTILRAIPEKRIVKTEIHDFWGADGSRTEKVYIWYTVDVPLTYEEWISGVKE